MDLPIDRLRERNNYRATLISFESELRNLSLTLDTLKDSIERGLRTLEQRRQTYHIQQGALQVANRRVIAAGQLIEAGRAEVRDLVEAQDAQVAAPAMMVSKTRTAVGAGLRRIQRATRSTRVIGRALIGSC